MAKIKPDAIIDKRIGKQKFHAEKIGGVWYFRCDSMPGFAAKYNGATDTEEAIAEFERRATESGEAKPA